MEDGAFDCISSQRSSYMEPFLWLPTHDTQTLLWHSETHPGSLPDQASSLHPAYLGRDRSGALCAEVREAVARTCSGIGISRSMRQETRRPGRLASLCPISLLRDPPRVSYTYSVVKFIVNVKLVEKRANSTVGKVIVVKVMIQINMPGIPLAMASKA